MRYVGNNVHETNIINHIMELVGIRSENGDKAGIEKAQMQLVEIANYYGFQSTLVASGQILIIEPKSSSFRHVKKPKLGILMHLDTVPLNESNWSKDPLGSISEGVVYGRGVIDDKGPIAIVLEALNNVTIQDYNRSWQVIVGCDEEGAFKDVERFLKEYHDSKTKQHFLDRSIISTLGNMDFYEGYELPEFMITVDGDGVQNGCRGYANLTITFKREIKTKFLKNVKVVNQANNVIPDGVLTEFTDGRSFEFNGKSCHSSIPENGINAIYRFVASVKENMKDEYAEYKRGYDFISSVSKDSSGSFFHLTDGISCEEEETSISVTNLEVDVRKGVLKLNLNMRLGVDFSETDLHEFENLLRKSYGAEVKEDGKVFYASYTNDDHGLSSMIDAYREVMGSYPNINVARGMGYNAAFPNCAIFGPRFDLAHDKDVDSCHMPDEHRSIEDIMTFYRMFVRFCEMFL